MYVCIYIYIYIVLHIVYVYVKHKQERDELAAQVKELRAAETQRKTAEKATEKKTTDTYN